MLGREAGIWTAHINNIYIFRWFSQIDSVFTSRSDKWNDFSNNHPDRALWPHHRLTTTDCACASVAVLKWENMSKIVFN